jgi:hypothetical protein
VLRWCEGSETVRNGWELGLVLGKVGHERAVMRPTSANTLIFASMFLFIKNTLMFCLFFHEFFLSKKCCQTTLTHEQVFTYEQTSLYEVSHPCKYRIR